MEAELLQLRTIIAGLVSIGADGDGDGHTAKHQLYQSTVDGLQRPSNDQERRRQQQQHRRPLQRHGAVAVIRVATVHHIFRVFTLQLL